MTLLLEILIGKTCNSLLEAGNSMACLLSNQKSHLSAIVLSYRSFTDPLSLPIPPTTHQKLLSLKDALHSEMVCLIVYKSHILSFNELLSRGPLSIAIDEVFKSCAVFISYLRRGAFFLERVTCFRLSQRKEPLHRDHYSTRPLTAVPPKRRNHFPRTW